jgi:S1-C subfamily serine protease
MLRAVLAILLSSLTLPLVAQDWPSVIDAVGPAVAKIELRSGGVLQSTGSGIAISHDGRILTCAHVVSDAQFSSSVTIQVTFPQAEHGTTVYPAKIEQISDEVDLAVVKVDANLGKVAELSSEVTPRLMGEILVVGFPLGMNFKATPGFIQAFQEVAERGSMLDLSASVDPGNSGGPVLGKDGKVVGVVASKIPGYNFNLALPARNVVDFLALAAHPVAFRVTTTPPGARVSVNGQYKGTSPVDVRLLTRKAEIEVDQEGFTTDKRTVEAGPNGVPDQTFSLVAEASLTTKVRIEVTPVGAHVWANNTDRGPAPAEWVADKGSRLRLRVEAFGYTTLNSVVDLGDENEQTVHVDLKKQWF